MFRNSTLLRFGCKSFRNHMDMQHNLTLRGLIRRATRKYPKTYRVIKTGLIGVGLYTAVLLLIPGCEIPLQQTIKISSYRLAALLFRMWDYNIFTPEPQNYVIRLSELVLLAMDSQIYSEGFMEDVHREIRGVVEENKKGMKSGDYLDLLLYSQIQLQNIIRFSNKLLLSPLVYQHYLWIYEILVQKLAKAQISLQQDKQVKLFYTLVQYLLNFGQKQQPAKVLSSFQGLISLLPEQEAQLKQANGQQRQFRFWVAKRAFEEKGFLQNLKKMYIQTENADLRTIILKIFEHLDRIHTQFNLH